jgi:hypothetical protein
MVFFEQMSLLQRVQDDELSEDPFMDEFKVLRRRVFQWRTGMFIQGILDCFCACPLGIT